MASNFRLVGFRVVEPKPSDKLIYIGDGGFKESVSKNSNEELWQKIFAEVKLSERKFEKNKWYFFNEGYETDEKGIVKKSSDIQSFNLYSNDKICIDVNCIVGKNGCGKSSIIELITKILNNFIFIDYGNRFNIEGDITFLKYAENMFCDLAFENGESIVVLSLRGRIISITENCKIIVENDISYGKDNFFSDYVTPSNYFNQRYIDKITNRIYALYTMLVGYKFNNIYSMSIDDDNQKTNGTFTLKHNTNKNKIHIPGDYITNNKETVLTKLSHNASIFALTKVPNDEYALPIKFVQTNFNQNVVKTSNEFVKSNDYTNQIKSINQDLYYNHILLQLCFYNENGKHPLRNINDQCQVIGIVKHLDSPIFPSYRPFVNNQELQECLLHYIRTDYEINIISDSKDAERLESIIITLVVNKLFTDFKEKYKNSIVAGWVDSKNYEDFEKKFYKEIIKARGISNLDNLNDWSEFKRKHSKDWLKEQLIDFLLPNIKDEFIIGNHFKDFEHYALEEYTNVINNNYLISQFVKLLRNLSNGYDIFFTRKKVNEPIYLEELYIDGVDIDDVIYALQYVNIDLVLRDEVMGERILDGLSSGERHLLNMRSILLHHLLQVDKQNKYKSINIMFDEIEMYLHPEWQRQFLSKIIDGIKLVNFKTITNINFLIVTHSPFILSDVPKSNILFLDEDGSLKNRNEVGQTFCANIHDMFNNGFFMESTLGEIAISNIKKIVELYQQSQHADNNNDKYIKEDLLKNKQYYTYLCDILGDRYYHKTISYMLNSLLIKYDKELLTEEEINKKIKEKEEEIENLKKLRKN